MTELIQCPCGCNQEWTPEDFAKRDGIIFCCMCGVHLNPFTDEYFLPWLQNPENNNEPEMFAQCIKCEAETSLLMKVQHSETYKKYVEGMAKSPWMKHRINNHKTDDVNRQLDFDPNDTEKFTIVNDSQEEIRKRFESDVLSKFKPGKTEFQFDNKKEYVYFYEDSVAEHPLFLMPISNFKQTFPNAYNTHMQKLTLGNALDIINERQKL